MIIEYDKSANLTSEQQLKSLQDSVQRAFDELMASYRDDLSTSSGEIYTTINLFRKDYAYFNQMTTEKLNADRADINTLTANDAIIEGKLNADRADINDLVSEYAEIDALVVNHTTSINQLTAEDATINDSLRSLTAEIGSIEANYVKTEDADIAYLKTGLANIDFANLDKTKVGTLFADMGLIDRATIVDGHVTGYLTSVSINANSITAGTLDVNHLIITDDTVVPPQKYLLNVDAQTGTSVYEKLDGNIVAPRSIAADRIVASSITANELDVASVTAATVTASNIMALNLETFDLNAWRATIGGFNVGENALFSPPERYVWDLILVEETDHLERSQMNEFLDLSEDTSAWLYDDLTGAEMAALNLEYDLSEDTSSWMTTVTYPEYRLLCQMNDYDPETYSSVYLGTDAIGLGDNFYVDIDGNMEAKNVDITGHIVATSGEISGSLLTGYIADPGENTVLNLATGEFKMTKGSINLANNFVVQSNGYVDMKRGRIRLGLNDGVYNFVLTDTGRMTLRDGEINLGNGNFRVTSGGMLTIRRGEINLGDNNFIVNNRGYMTLKRGSIDLGDGAFTVNNYGQMSATAGFIGGFTIGTTGLRRGESGYGYVYLGESGIRVGSDFSVDEYGALRADDLTASSGSIGAWGINSTYLWSQYGIYEARLQKPAAYNSWVYSTLQNGNVTFGVTANGELVSKPGNGSIRFGVETSGINARCANTFLNMDGTSASFGAQGGAIYFDGGVTVKQGISSAQVSSSEASINHGNAHVTVDTTVWTRSANGAYGIDITNSSMILYGGNIRLGNITSYSSSLYLCIDSDGRIHYTSGTSSSRKIKHDVKPVENEILDPKRLYDADVVQFKYNDDFLAEGDPNRGRDLIGFIVENLAEVYPVAVTKDDPDESKTWTWSPTQLLPAMLKLIQDQHADIETMKEEINEMRRETKLC